MTSPAFPVAPVESNLDPSPSPGGSRPASGHVPPFRGRLFYKYAFVVGTLVCGAVLASGLLELYFSSNEANTALTELHQKKARDAARTIEQFVQDVERQIDWILPTGTPSAASSDWVRGDYLRLLARLPAITEVSYLDSTGKEQLRVSRMAINKIGTGVDYSRHPAFLEASPTRTYFGPVYFRSESEPYMTVSMADLGPSGPVTVAEVNLKFVWDLVSEIKVGETGLAYVVDSRGRLIAHPDLSLVLQRTNLSSLPQVQAALARGTGADEPSQQAVIAPDAWGREVFSAGAGVRPTGWVVFVEQPLAEAFAPIYSSVLRTVVLLLLGLLASIAASLFLARRMVRPIRQIEEGARRLGAGSLDQRISVRTGDELQALAEEFNLMAAQLRDSYGSLEQKVRDRTRSLDEALEALEQKSRQLEVASRHKSEFLAYMSHELRTPLTAIIGFSEVLLHRMAGAISDEQDEYLQNIHTSGQHLLELINDVLDLSKIEAGRMELEVSTFTLRPTLEAALTVVRERASRAGIALSLTVDPAVGLIRADERKIRQVLVNLLSNAVKFTQDGQVDITARLEGTEVEIAVRDTGVGIAPEDQARIFEAFQQGGRSPSEPHQGTGLGLALAKQFVQAHGGRIRLQSEVGLGSTFSVVLPLRQPDDRGQARAPRVEPSLPPVADGETPTVLVVEDDERSLDLMRLYLSGAGFRVAMARDGHEGFQMARRLRPAAITLDIALPHADGWDFLTRARADPAIGRIPVIVVSMLDERLKGLALGAADYLVKPVTRDSLLGALRRVVPSGTAQASPPVGATEP